MKLRVIYTQIKVLYTTLNDSTSAVGGQREEAHKMIQLYYYRFAVGYYCSSDCESAVYRRLKLEVCICCRR